MGRSSRKRCVRSLHIVLTSAPPAVEQRVTISLFQTPKSIPIRRSTPCLGHRAIRKIRRPRTGPNQAGRVARFSTFFAYFRIYRTGGSGRPTRHPPPASLARLPAAVVGRWSSISAHEHERHGRCLNQITGHPITDPLVLVGLKLAHRPR